MLQNTLRLQQLRIGENAMVKSAKDKSTSELTK